MKNKKYFVWSPSDLPFNSLKLQSDAMVRLIADAGLPCTLLTPKTCSIFQLFLKISKKDSVIIWHFGAFDVRLIVAQFFPNITVVYHNITPWYFFIKSRPLVAVRSFAGELQLRLLPKSLQYIGVSPFNSFELKKLKKSMVWTVPCYVRHPSSVIRNKSRHPSVFFNGRIAENKNVANLLDIINSVATSCEKRLILIVNGSDELVRSDKKNLDSAIDKMRSNKNVRLVWIKSGLDEREIDRIYQFAWVYTSASLHEGFGLPIFEAILNRTPAIYKKCGGTESILKNAGCIDVNSDAEFVAKLNELLNDEKKRSVLVNLQNSEIKKTFRNASIVSVLLENIPDVVVDRLSY